MINPTIFFSFNFWQVGRCGICLTFYKRLCPMKMLTDEWHVTSNDGMKFLQLTTEHRRFLISKTIDLKSELRKFLRWIWNWSAQEVQRVIIGMPMRNPRLAGIASEVIVVVGADTGVQLGSKKKTHWARTLQMPFTNGNCYSQPIIHESAAHLPLQEDSTWNVFVFRSY